MLFTPLLFFLSANPGDRSFPLVNPSGGMSWDGLVCPCEGGKKGTFWVHLLLFVIIPSFLCLCLLVVLKRFTFYHFGSLRFSFENDGICMWSAFVLQSLLSLFPLLLFVEASRGWKDRLIAHGFYSTIGINTRASALLSLESRRKNKDSHFSNSIIYSLHSLAYSYSKRRVLVPIGAVDPLSRYYAMITYLYFWISAARAYARVCAYVRYVYDKITHAIVQ